MCDCGDGPETYRQTNPVAKREHKCCECRGVIRVGEKYRSVWGVWEGESQTFKTCLDCLALHDWCEGDGSKLCTTFGNLHTDVLDFMGESGDAALKAEAAARVKAIREKRRRPVAA